MATINVQAGSAAHVLASRPEVAAEALQSIKAASKDGLRELRAILNVLRLADHADPTQPAPGLAQLDTLVAGARRAGLETTLTVTGTAAPLPAAADLAAYRIIQGVADQHDPARRPGDCRGLGQLHQRRGSDLRH